MPGRIINVFRAYRILVAFILGHGLIFLGFVLLALFYYPNTGEAELFVSTKIFDGLVPYRDFQLEYPPLAMLFFLLPHLFSVANPGFSFALAAELFVADVIVLIVIARLAPRLGSSSFHLLAVYTLLVIGVGPIIASRYDLWPAALLLVGLAAFAGGKTKLAWAAIALNVCAKIYGVVILPLFVIYHLAKRQYRRLAEGIAAFAVTSIVLILPWVIVDFGGFLNSMEYHLRRGLHSESTYGTGLLMAELFGKTDLRVDYGFGSWNVYSPLADIFARHSFWVTGAALAALYIVFAVALWSRGWRGAVEPTDANLVFQFSVLGITIFLLTSKVFSAQYIVWLCPLVLLGARDRLHAVAALFFAAGLLTQWIYPYYYGDFLAGRAWAVIPAALRDLALLAIAMLMIRPRAWTGTATKASR